MSLRDIDQIFIEREISGISQKHLKRDFCDVFKTFQIHQDVFYVTSLRCLEHISKKMSIP